MTNLEEVDAAPAQEVTPFSCLLQVLLAPFASSALHYIKSQSNLASTVMRMSAAGYAVE